MESALFCTRSPRQSGRLWWKMGEQYSSTDLITIQWKSTNIFTAHAETKKIHRGYYMAVRRYEVSLRVLKNISRESAANE